MKDEQSLDDFGDVDLTGSLSSTHLAVNLTADKLLDELTSLPQQHSLYSNIANSSRNTYDQFFEEVSLDLPRQQQEQTTPPRLMKFMPRRPNSNQNSNSSSQVNVTYNTETSSSDISGPFYSISDVLDDTAINNATTSTTVNVVGRESGDYESIDVNNPTNPRAARRNVNEAEVIATSGGTSIGPVRRRSM